MPLSSRIRTVDHTGHVRASIGTRTKPGWLADDSHEESESFEAWVCDLPQASTAREATSPAASDGRESALTLHATLRHRAKLIRGLLLVASIGLPLVLLLNAIQASAAGQRLATRSSLSHPIVVRDRALAPWLASSSGRGSAAGALDVQPATMNGDVVYACWVESPSGSSAPGPAPLHLAISSDGAYTWRTLSSPVPRASACRLVADAGDARRIALIVQLDARTAAGCPTSQIFASDDGGVHWSAIHLPTVLAGACGLALSSVGGTLVLWTNGPATSGTMSASARVWISLDAGVMWRSAGAGLPSGSVESLVSGRADGALLVLLRRAAAPQAPSELWSCSAGCLRWQRVGVVPGSAPSVFAAPGGWLSPGDGWGTLYALDTLPAASGSLYASSGTQPGAWRVLPPLPWPAVDSSGLSESARQSHILGVGPGGSLVLEWPSAAVALAPSGATQEQAVGGVLSMWDPGSGRWLTPVLVEPAGDTVLAIVWDEQGTNAARRLTIWFETRSGDVWSLVVPSEDWQAAQVAPRCQRCG